MPLLDTVKQRVAEVRERRPFVDHLIRMVEHYGFVNGSALAGAVTFFGFLSFFPILALGFAVVGWVARIYPEAQDQMVEAIRSVLPMVVKRNPSPSQISVEAFQTGAGAAAGLGVVGLLYSGLGWVSGLRTALQAVFETPRREQPSFVVGKAKDLLALVLVGVVLMLAVAVSAAVNWLSGEILGWIGLDQALKPLVGLIGVVVALAANSVLFFAIFKVLADHDTPDRSLRSGALLGAIAFEVLKQAAAFLIASTQGSPAFAVFGIALVLLIWINYFSRVVLFAAAWAHTSVESRERRAAQAAAAGRAEGPRIDVAAAAAGGVPPASADAPSGASPKAAFAAGAAAMLGLVALVRRRR
ncbi:YihY/virulence factor BrkB family protein [Nocardioides sp. J2M5]|uniref:YihY/virulence factor BrkB family protein n=1 Tax=Nocardioides palaemonis TaxID=2829810 RepID=UPI001BAA78CC|nr:YihY/virulence factor BrkB family protein [Nocardioides palaemonis]MBS2939170.1 YihY/virulence factor BrkB family protein [Nocardioides palaemonis]